MMFGVLINHVGFQVRLEVRIAAVLNSVLMTHTRDGKQSPRTGEASLMTSTGTAAIVSPSTGLGDA